MSDKKIKSIKNCEKYFEEDFRLEDVDNSKSVTVVGSGPAGLFCAYLLAKNKAKVKVIERGSEVSKRVDDIEHFLKTGELNTNSNVQFGEGGAGTFSDGKLTARSKDKRVREVLKTFVDYGAPSEIMYDSKPVSYTHLRAHETPEHLVCRLLLEKKKKKWVVNLNLTH